MKKCKQLFSKITDQSFPSSFLTVTFLLILVWGFHLDSAAQGCLPEGITFTNQQQIDDFSVNYPGCTFIEGDVIILGYDSITSLLGLNQISQVGGGFGILGCEVLNSLSGLENLSIINGGLAINYNSLILDIDPLSNLDSIGGQIGISNNNNTL